jgi:asparagine synthase (glutamine-hydrolysing)
LQRLYPDIEALASTGSSYLAAFFGAGLRDVADPLYSHAIRWRTSGRNCRFLAPDLHRAAAAPAAPAGPELPAAFATWDGLQRAQFLEIVTFLSPYLLAAQGDRVAMAHSVEGRFPFLDVRVIEFCNRLPPRFKLRGLTEKYLLRRLARRWLPAEIGQRGKRPYRAPIHRCFVSQPPPPYLPDLLSPGALRASGLFRPDAVGQLLAKVQQDRPIGETDEMALVGIVSGQLWHEQFIRNFRPAEPLTSRDDVKIIRRLAPGP